MISLSYLSPFHTKLDPDTIPPTLKTDRPPPEEDDIIFQQLYLPDQGGAPESGALIDPMMLEWCFI